MLIIILEQCTTFFYNIYIFQVFEYWVVAAVQPPQFFTVQRNKKVTHMLYPHARKEEQNVLWGIILSMPMLCVKNIELKLQL